jgi:hypothetical protein
VISAGVAVCVLNLGIYGRRFQQTLLRRRHQPQQNPTRR